MPPTRVEGYETNASSMTSKSGMTDEWLDSLRDDMQQQVVRKLAEERIKAGHWGEQPDPHTGKQSYAVRVLEGVAIGVVVTIMSAWICSSLGVKKDKTK